MRANMRTGNILMDTRSNTPTTITRNREETISPHQVDTSSKKKVTISTPKTTTTYPQTTVVTSDGNSYSIFTRNTLLEGPLVFETFNGQTKAVDWTCKDLLTPPEEVQAKKVDLNELSKKLEVIAPTQPQRKRSASI
jgi:hypothetical protein